MAWSTSKLFRQWMTDTLGQTYTTMAQADLDVASSLKAVLYDNSITPDQDVTAAASAYTGGVWTATGGQTGTAQVYHTGQWAQGGIVVPSTALSNVAGGITKFTSGNIVSGAAATMSNIYGMYIYIDAITAPTADVGLGYWYFGGTGYSVTSGTLTVTPNASGLFTMSV